MGTREPTSIPSVAPSGAPTESLYVVWNDPVLLETTESVGSAQEIGSLGADESGFSLSTLFEAHSDSVEISLVLIIFVGCLCFCCFALLCVIQVLSRRRERCDVDVSTTKMTTQDVPPRNLRTFNQELRDGHDHDLGHLATNTFPTRKGTTGSVPRHL